MEPNKADVKKKLEEIAGHELVVAPEQFIRFRFPVSAYDSADGLVAWQHIFFPGMSCEDARLLDVSSASYSGADGKRVIRLSDVVCLGDYRLLAEPVNVLATARIAKPFFVTNTHSLISPTDPHSSDIEITFFVWDPSGAAAPDIVFDWRCRAINTAAIILRGAAPPLAERPR